MSAATDPGPALARFPELPQIVALMARHERRAVGVTVDGVAVELIVAAPERLGTELVRATGSPEYVASLGALPEAADEDAALPSAGPAVVPAGAA